MQGQRGAIGSLPESLAFEHGSGSTDSGVVDQQTFWNTNNVQQPPPNRLSDYILPTNTEDLFLNSTDQEGHNISMWNVGEASSSSVPNQVSQSHIESRTASMLSLGDSDTTNVVRNDAHNLSTNPPSYVGFKPFSISESYRGSSASSSSFSDPFGPSSDAFELEGRRLSRKRKAVESSVGQPSSGVESSRAFQRQEGGSSSVWCPVADSPLAADTTPLDPTIPRLGLGVGASTENRVVESTHRNVRLRLNTSHQINSPPANSDNGQSNRVSPFPPLRLNPVDLGLPPLDTAAESSSNHQAQPVLRIPALRRNLQASSRWNRSSGSRANRSSNVVIPADRSEFDSRTLPTNILDLVQPSETRNTIHNESNWSLTGSSGSGGANSSNAGNDVGSSSLAGSSSGPTPPSTAMHRSSPHYPPRRLSEILRRSLLSSTDLPGGAGRNRSAFPRGPPAVGASASSSHDTGIPALVSIQGHHHLPHSRSLRLVDRQPDGAFGFPDMSRVATGSEGRGRLVSEIRNVLDLMRRGEALRFEDLMILDQSVFFGAADIHDRHRDMRLDIDNMSYEELLALEERIGDVNTGLTEETIFNHLKQKKYLTITGQPEAEPCCVCQEEYNNGDDLGSLECGHDFHTGCIKQWLLHKNMCPICKSTAFNTK